MASRRVVLRRIMLKLSQQRLDILDAICDLKKADRSDLFNEMLSDYCINTIKNTPLLAHLFIDMKNIFQSDS